MHPFRGRRANLRGGFRDRGGSGHQYHGRVRSSSQILTELQKTTDDNILLQLLNTRTGFLDLLQTPDRIFLDDLPSIFHILTKACNSNTSPHLTIKLIHLILDSSFISERMPTFCSFEILEIDHNFKMPSDKAQQLLIDIFSVLMTFYVHLESLSHERLYNIVCGMNATLRRLETQQSSSVSLSVRRAFDSLNKHVTKITLRRQSNTHVDHQRHRDNPVDNRTPPEDFRTLPVQPTLEDLRGVAANKVFLRKSITEGGYGTVEHYLDVQFRLTREDFVAPLREGIEQYLNDDHRRKNTNIRIYKNAKVLHPYPSDSGIVHLVRFNNDHLRNVHWDASKRFIFGSLVVLSSDALKSAHFAVVADRDITNLQKGLITLRFFDSVPPNEVCHDMLESTVYFEAYTHVLHQLQKIDTDVKKFPMAQYIVFCNRHIEPPVYLKQNAILTYDLKVIRDARNGLSQQSLIIRPMSSDINWPSKEALGLDDSQMAALKSSITKEFVLIQGPPGTGKTYMGLKIAKVLLECVQSNFANFGPILVVCFTNHALDQFLEGIHQFLSGRSLVRVGGRSKSETMQKFSLSSLRKKLIDSRMVPGNIFVLMKKITGELRDVSEEIIANRNLIQFTFTRITELINLDYFQIVDENIRMQLVKSAKHQRNAIRSWLLNIIESDIEQTLDDIWSFAMNDIVDVLFHENLFNVTVDLFEEIRMIQMDCENTCIEDDIIWETNRRVLDEDDNGKITDGWRRILFDINDEEDNYRFNDNEGWQVQTKKKQLGRFIRSNLNKSDVMTQIDITRVRDINALDINDRWKIYRFWIQNYRKQLYDQSAKLEQKYNDLSQQKNELRKEEDMLIMQKANIIGITTTGAARYGNLLSKLHCKVIIIEEAAEVLESHVVSSLSSGLEHLILIGDHKQLKPSAAVYNLAKNYGLDLSLFERMINNRIHFDTLTLQHRMRPQIAEIMRFIYKDLKNHSSVNDYEDIRGICTNIFFFSHKQKEENAEDILSYSNPFEAKMTVGLCKHFLLNGYKPEQITILTLYSGQLFALKKLMPRQTFDKVRVCVVDNYQGEENDIIILSLVRSNEHENIGFLNIENRVCVALSRAKMGLFVFGNFELLASKNKLWYKIVSDLVHKGQLGQKISLKCQNHPEDPGVQISKPEDFETVPEGGCKKNCGIRLRCGHSCPKSCHVTDRNHLEYLCLKPCNRKCPNGHACLKNCSEICPNCLKLVEKVIPDCGHTQLVPCSVPAKSFECKENCTRKLKQCGHLCTKKCREPCLKKSSCRVLIKRSFTYCEHTVKAQCGAKIVCNEPCGIRLQCGHTCQGTCGSCSNSNLHILACRAKCDRTLVCGHTCQALCSMPCPPCSQPCSRGCLHQKCEKKCGEICNPCTHPCLNQCMHGRCSTKCGEICTRAPCVNPCPKLLSCKRCKESYKCIGICGEVCPPYCPHCDLTFLSDLKKELNSSLVALYITLQTCSHTFEVTVLDSLMNATRKEGNTKWGKLVCPKCKSAITLRSCHRYEKLIKQSNNSVKSALELFTKKSKQLLAIGCINNLRLKWQNIGYLEQIGLKFDVEYLKNFESIINQIRFFDDSCPKEMIVALENSATLLSKFNDSLMQHFSLMESKTLKKHVTRSLKQLLEWLDPSLRCYTMLEIRVLKDEWIRIRHIMGYEQAMRQPLAPNILSQLREEGIKLVKYCQYPKAMQNCSIERYKQILNLQALPDFFNEWHSGIQYKSLDFQAIHWLTCEKDHVRHYRDAECTQCLQIRRLSRMMSSTKVTLPDSFTSATHSRSRDSGFGLLQRDGVSAAGVSSTFKNLSIKQSLALKSPGKRPDYPF